MYVCVCTYLYAYHAYFFCLEVIPGNNFVCSGSTAVRRSKAAAAAAALQYSNANRATAERSMATAASVASSAKPAESGDQIGGNVQCLSPKRSHSLSAADSASSGWKRPWMSQVLLSVQVYY